MSRGLPKSLPKLTSSQSTEENSEHLAELKTPANNSDALSSARCKAVYTGSIPVVAFRSTCKSAVVVQAIVVSPSKGPQSPPNGEKSRLQSEARVQQSEVASEIGSVAPRWLLHAHEGGQSGGHEL
jgi:hypothetical protein